MVFTNEIHNAPAAIPLLDVLERECGHFGAAKTATKKHRKYRAVPQTLRGRDVWCAQQRLGLAESKPISGADSLGAHAFDP